MKMKPYNDATAVDFSQLFKERFPDCDTAVLDVFLSNPVREQKDESGWIAYDDIGRVSAIQGLLPRIAYCGKKRLLVANAVAMAVRKDANRNFFTDFLRESIQGYGADMMFGNTAIPGSRKRLQAAVGVQDGPASCAEIRERAVRASGRLARAVRMALAAVGMRRPALSLPSSGEVILASADLTVRRVTEMLDSDFDLFWQNYLLQNEGLVSSRTAAELKWAFASGLKTGEIVLLTAERSGALVGYVFCRRTDETAACWCIVDMIALRNDEAVLVKLVGAATAFLRRRTPAICLQITGFPVWVQPLLRRLFPKSSSFGFNKCIWVCLNEMARELCDDWVKAKSGWYGCPYDGDMCLI